MGENYNTDGFYEEEAGQGNSGWGVTADEAMTVGKWVITLILLYIPLINIIMLIVWLVNDHTPPVKKNFLIAYIIVAVIMIAVSIVGAAAFVGSLLFSLG